MLEKSPIEQSDKDLQTQVYSDDTSTQKRPKGPNLFLIPVQMALMVAVLLGSYFTMERMAANREEPGRRAFNPQPLTVEAATISRDDYRPTILVYGQIETARDIELRPLVAGEIVSVNPGLAAGARIEEGDLLVEIDRFNYEGAVLEAKANLAQTNGAIREIDARLASEKDQLVAAIEQLDLAQADLERAQSLVQSGTLTTKQVDDRVLIVSQRAQSVSQRENNILIYDAQREQQVANAERLAWKLNEAENQLNDTVLRAPFSGIISSSNAEPGRAVTANDVVASIYDDTALEVVFTLTNAQYGRMAADSDPLIGRNVEVIWTIGATDYSYSGTIDRIGATVAADRGGVEVVALVDPASHAVQLRPGAFVEIIVPDRLYENTVKVPETSIYDQSHIFLVEDGQLSRRDVNVLAFDGNDAIVSEYEETTVIAKDAQLLITRLTQASDGTRVRIEGQAPPQGQRGQNRGGNGRGNGEGRPQNAQNGAENSNTTNQTNNDRRQNPNRPRAVNRGLGG